MTSRNLTEVFVLMRNNARASRNIYADHRSDGGDSERLLQRSLHDAEEGLELRGGGGGADDCGAPPVWTDKLEETQYTLSKIRPKLDDLAALHDRHLLRPTLDDRCDEAQPIEALSQEIAKLIHSAHRHIQCIRSSLGHGNRLEQRLTGAVVAYLLHSLQDVTTAFRNGQGTYLRRLHSREARSNVFFEANADFTTIDLNGAAEPPPPPAMAVAFSTDLPGSSGGGAGGGGLDEFLSADAYAANHNGFAGSTDEQIDAFFQQPVSAQMTQQQLLLFDEENTRMAEHREQEVTKVVRSIVDLNEIFKDLATMVQEQGTILDRIDYNVEQTSTTVGEGLKQLRQAEVYHRKNRKMVCILVLASVTLLMLLLLIFTKL